MLYPKVKHVVSTLGRPKKEPLKTCKYAHGCENIPEPPHAYCCKEHAPLGDYGTDKGWKKWYGEN